MARPERLDVIVDFTGLAPGTELFLINEATRDPTNPFGGCVPPFADPDTTGQVMKLEVVALASRDTSRPPDQLTLSAFRNLRGESNTRQVSLDEESSTANGFDGPIAALLGTMNNDGTPESTEVGRRHHREPALNSIEVW